MRELKDAKSKEEINSELEKSNDQSVEFCEIEEKEDEKKSKAKMR